MAFYKVCGNYYGTDNDANSLMHYRTPGSKNGVRKYQYEDGTLTPAGRIHYGVGKGGAAKSVTAYTDTGTRGPVKVYPNKSMPVKGVGLGPKGTQVGLYRAKMEVPYEDSVPAAIDRDAEYRAGRGLREPVSNATSNILQRDARRPSGVAGNIYDARNWIDSRASDVRDWGERAMNDTKRFVGVGGTREAAEDARSRSNETRDRLTAENAKRIQDNDLINKQRADKQFGPSQSYADQFNENTRINYVNNQRQMAEAGREARAAEEAHGKTIIGRAERAYNDASKAVDDAKQWVGERASDVKTWGEQATKDVGKAASDVKKWGDQAGKDIGKAASDVKTWGEQAAKDVGKAAKDVGNAVGTAAKNVGNAVGNAAKDVGEWGKGAVDKGRDFITGLFGKKKKG